MRLMILGLAEPLQFLQSILRDSINTKSRKTNSVERKEIRVIISLSLKVS